MQHAVFLFAPPAVTAVSALAVDDQYMLVEQTIEEA
jgi:hypothetical protein